MATVFATIQESENKCFDQTKMREIEREREKEEGLVIHLCPEKLQKEFTDTLSR